MASNSYQTVVAGRVREDEGITFFKSNKVAVPSGAWAITSQGGKKQPTIDTPALQDEAVGKKDGRAPVKSAYNPTGNNVG
jgi:DNA/RNA endonuclease G (NUC1)